MTTKIFLAGDVMIGRGIDQILPFPSPPQIYESFVTDAREYVYLAENTAGKIDYPVSFDYIWGQALSEMEKAKPDLKIINLETTITSSSNYLPKGINYRMNPKNINVLKVFGVNACILANNHILDWQEEGLMETIKVLQNNKIIPIGAGKNLPKAKSPAIFSLPNGRIIIFACAHPSSGVPINWQAGKEKPGVNLLTKLSAKEIFEIKKQVAAVKQNQDFVIFSIHWGPNWGYEIDKTFVDFAHQLIDFAGVDLIFGHSSHHFKGFEIYKDKLILYGAGDFINDYEGIQGYEEFRGDLTLMYFPEINLATKKIVSLTLVPLQIKRLRLNRPKPADVNWILKVLQRESKFEGKLEKNGSWQSPKITVRLFSV